MGNNKKVFRDPIYNLISFDKDHDQLILDLINTPEVLRLKRIRQLGISSYTYPTAVHDRFSHALGVAFLAGRIFDSIYSGNEIIITNNSDELTLPREEFRLLLQATGLLHDVGHGPFSHAFEKLTNVDHEALSQRIILRPDGSIFSAFSNCKHELLREYGAQWVTEILNGTFSVPWAKDIISSQFDADRIDYLLRDAHMCGVKYAIFDLDWLLHNMELREIDIEHRKGIVINASKGLHSLEAFIISRYHMYEQVYFHKTTRGFEVLVEKIFDRLKELISNNDQNAIGYIHESLLTFVQDSSCLDSFHKLDDFSLTTHIATWKDQATDPILQMLSDAFINRKPYKMIKEADEVNVFSPNEIETLFNTLPPERRFYYFTDSYLNNPYKDEYLLGKKESEGAERIWISDGKGVIADITSKSTIIESLRNHIFKKTRGYVHRDYLHNIDFLNN